MGFNSGFKGLNSSNKMRYWQEGFFDCRRSDAPSLLKVPSKVFP